MSKEYIERSAAIAALKNLPFQADIEDLGIYEEIKDVLAADVAPVKHGRWLNTDSFDAHYTPIYKCSECWKDVADHFINNHKFCLHCGAQMDGGNK